MRALVVASAPCVFDDAREAFRAGGYDRFYAVNAAAVRWPLTDVWVTGHPEKLAEWQAAVLLQGRPLPDVVARHKIAGEDAIVHRTSPLFWPKQDRMAITSTLYAVKVALEDGARRVVICGAPLDVNGGHIDRRAPQDHDYRRFRGGFIWAAEHVFAGRVRAASGFLADLLGRPDEEWLNA